MTRRMHFGLELNFSDFMFLRAGLNQRYWTAGIEIATEHCQVQFASYGEDVGTAATPQEDRRWVAKVALRF